MFYLFTVGNVGITAPFNITGCLYWETTSYFCTFENTLSTCAGVKFFIVAFSENPPTLFKKVLLKI
jgi:hypothetical protein